MRIKICGITKPQQGIEIVSLGATALGFICVKTSPRYIDVNQIRAIVEKVPSDTDKIGVFANASIQDIAQITVNSGLTGIQLHGEEPPEFCQQLREYFPDLEIIKALRIKNIDDLSKVNLYFNKINTLLLDAYHPQQLGGTGKKLDWQTLKQFNPGLPWFLAGGLTPDNVLEALALIEPDGIDLSSGVERSPGDKDLDLVAKLFERLGIGN